MTEFKTFTDVFPWLKNCQFAPVFTVITDEYYLQQKIETILVEKFYDGTAKDFNFNIVYGSETNGSEVNALASSYPMMAERRVVIVREAEKLLKEKDQTAAYFQKPSGSTLLILIANSLNRNSSPWNKIPKEGLIIVPKIYDNQVRPWIKELAKSFQFTISDESIEFIISTMGANITFIAAEFEKMSVADIPNRNLSIDVIAAYTGIRKEYNPWEFRDALVKNDEDRAQQMAIRMLQSGENPVGIVANLASAFKSMWLTSYHLALDKNFPPPKPYPQLIEYNQVKALGQRASRKIEFVLEQLFHLDSGLKGFSPFPPEILFSRFIADVCNFEKRED